MGESTLKVSIQLKERKGEASCGEASVPEQVESNGGRDLDEMPQGRKPAGQLSQEFLEGGRGSLLGSIL